MQLPEHFLSDGTSSTTFSILVRIDPHAAHRYDCRRRNSSRLSVSSCGSTLMQHTAISGRRDAPRPFSILVRIDPHAAMIYQKRCSSSYIFQYPRADRPSCSPGLCYCHSPLLNLLSVSSCGSTLMQPKYCPRRTVWHALTFSILVRIDPHAALLHHGKLPTMLAPFSILVRIDPHAAAQVHQSSWLYRSLSVSSCGSTLMQQYDKRAHQ